MANKAVTQKPTPKFDYTTKTHFIQNNRYYAIALSCIAYILLIPISCVLLIARLLRLVGRLGARKPV